MTPTTVPTYRFLGVSVQPLTKTDLLSAIESTVDSSADNGIIGNHNLHSLYLLHRDDEMKQFYDVNRYTHIDGMSMILLARMLGVPLRRDHRTTYLDWFEDFLALAERKKWRLYFLGGREEMIASIPERLLTRYPNLLLRSHHGFDAFSPNTSVFGEIEEFAPHAVLVGMGMPLQERWILEARNRIRTHLFLPCGAAMEYLMNFQKAPPRWIGRIGLEWLYRFISRPKALYRRYLLEPLVLLPIILREVAARRAYVKE